MNCLCSYKKVIYTIFFNNKVNNFANLLTNYKKYLELENIVMYNVPKE